MKILEQPNTEIKESTYSGIRYKETIKIDHANLKSRTLLSEE